MTPQHSIVKHDPPHSYGDCLRACIASVMDQPIEQVPHFAAHGATGDEAMVKVRQHLVPMAPFIVAWPGDIALGDLHEMQRVHTPHRSYILFGGTHNGGDHCVVCQGGEIVHNPAWYGCNIVGPLSNGTWQVLVVGRV